MSDQKSTKSRSGRKVSVVIAATIVAYLLGIALWVVFTPAEGIESIVS